MLTHDKSEAQLRLDVIRQLLREGLVSSQEDICENLKRHKFAVTQSTVSRDLRRLGAIKVMDSGNRTTYRLPDESLPMPISEMTSFSNLLRDIQHNDSMIVIHTSTGSASLVARQLDSIKPGGILGTLAGDDTIFVAPSSGKNIQATIKAIRQALS